MGRNFVEFIFVNFTLSSIHKVFTDFGNHLNCHENECVEFTHES